MLNDEQIARVIDQLTNINTPTGIEVLEPRELINQRLEYYKNMNKNNEKLIEGEK